LLLTFADSSQAPVVRQLLYLKGSLVSLMPGERTATH
jgi:hypothetical protein